MYDGSLRMPFIIRYPALIEPGTVVEDLVNNVVFAPTLLELVGVEELPEQFQGRSFVPNLRDRSPDDWRTATYYRYWMHMAHHDNPAHYGIRTQRYKLIFFYGLPLDAPGSRKKPTPPYWELYDLKEDPQEMNNVYADADYAGVVKMLKARLLQLKQKLGDTDAKYPRLMERREKAW